MPAPSSLPGFVHRRLHSEYSITDGLTRIDEAIAQAAADGQPALDITDLAKLFSMVRFYAAERATGNGFDAAASFLPIRETKVGRLTDAP